MDTNIALRARPLRPADTLLAALRTMSLALQGAERWVSVAVERPEGCPDLLVQ